MWLSELEKGMTVWYYGVDHKVYSGTIQGWSARHAFIRRLYRDDLETVLIDWVSAEPIQWAQEKNKND